MRPGESVRRIGVLIRRNLLLMWGEPGPLLSRMILPLAFLTLLGPLYAATQGGAGGTEQAVVAPVSPGYRDRPQCSGLQSGGEADLPA